MTTFTEFRRELMGEPIKKGEEALGLTQEQIIEGLRGLVLHAEKQQARAEIALGPLQEKADKLDRLREAINEAMTDG